MMDILFEDQQLLVCEKPAGIPVQTRGVGTMDLESMLINYLWEKGENGKKPYLAVVHRLDQPVQGVLVFAKTKAAAASLSTQASDGKMKKEYLAVVCGAADEKEGTLVDYLLKDGRSNISRIVCEETAGAKRAELDYCILEERGGLALVQVRLQTGRHHQIRVQMAGNGMPLAGDKKYNPVQEKNYAPIALCAHRLSFLHPASQNLLTFACIPRGFYFTNFEKKG